MKKSHSVSQWLKVALRWLCLVGIIAESIFSPYRYASQLSILGLLIWFQVFFLFDFFN